MDNIKIAEDLVKIAKKLVSTKYNMSVEKKTKLLMKAFKHIKPVVERLSKLESFSHNDEEKVHVIFDKLIDISNELTRID